MRNALLLAGIALSALASAAHAADLPTKKGPPPAPTIVAPAFSWTGFYVGVNAGYADPTASLGVSDGVGWAGPPTVDPDWNANAKGPGVAAAGTHAIGLHGFLGGAQAGYNYQINNFVIGAEADADYMNLRGSYATPIYTAANGTGEYWANGSAGLDSLFTVRARAGLAFDRLLLFATGGVAFTGERFSQSIGFSNPTTIITLPTTPNGVNGYNAGAASTTAVTGVFGGGLEYAFDSQWSLKGEYLYAPLKSQSFSSTYVDTSSNPWTIQHHESLSGLNVFRLGLNYRL
jgi:outer membrane immunogenic protein